MCTRVLTLERTPSRVWLYSGTLIVPVRAVFLSLALLGCTGIIIGPRPEVISPSATGGGTATTTGGGTTTPTGPDPEVETPTSAIPRLSRREIERTLFDVFGLRGVATRNLPADPPSSVNPSTLAEEEAFDTLADEKAPSAVFVEGLETLAFEVGRDFVANSAAVATLAGCTPSGSGVDATCLGQLVDVVALRLWRRPLTSTERGELLTSATTVATMYGGSQHLVAVRAAITSLVQSPEFVYRTELGTPTADPSVITLTDRELVGRLAAFLWGSAPTSQQLALVQAGPLDDAALARLVDGMLADPKFDAQLEAFHKMWLRYDGLLISDSMLAADMLGESDALLRRALTQGTPWTKLLDSDQSYLTPRLATHYGVTAPASTGWVTMPTPRAGILSHGAFLSLSSTRGTETLPSRRGAMLARRVLCQTIRPPPKDVNIDNGVVVAPGSCKVQAYQAHRARGGACAGCHAVLDGLGFGFERLDGQGRFRMVEPDNAACSIDGRGDVAGTPFSGPKELVTNNRDLITRCAVEQLSRFGFRDRHVARQHVDRFHETFTASSHDFRQLVRSIALDPRFRLRIQERP